MLFRFLTVLFGVNTKQIMDGKYDPVKKAIMLDLVTLKIVKVFGLYFCKLERGDCNEYSLLDDETLYNYKVSFYYNFIKELLKLNKEVELNGNYYMVSSELRVLSIKDIVCSKETISIMGHDEFILYGVNSMDYGSRKLYDRLHESRKLFMKIVNVVKG